MTGENCSLRVMLKKETRLFSEVKDPNVFQLRIILIKQEKIKTLPSMFFQLKCCKQGSVQLLPKVMKFENWTLAGLLFKDKKLKGSHYIFRKRRLILGSHSKHFPVKQIYAKKEIILKKTLKTKGNV